MADATCLETVDYRARYDQIRYAHEQQFVDENADRLDQFLRAIDAAKTAGAS